MGSAVRAGDAARRRDDDEKGAIDELAFLQRLLTSLRTGDMTELQKIPQQFIYLFIHTPISHRLMVGP